MMLDAAMIDRMSESQVRMLSLSLEMYRRPAYGPDAADAADAQTGRVAMMTESECRAYLIDALGDGYRFDPHWGWAG